ncbi:hypothetical protein NQ317_004476 [Molorchus minor]|uniref:Tyrosinase copper-binding domain-containing protein n=1 Tax=Molorchus minor TaxID=1323400 RepID=A0ABQ9ISW9_9CUCU|nr:hypothetical protein NQ317_004476 [Molorchus minor]
MIKQSVLIAPPEYLNEKHRPYGLQVVNRIGENVEDHITIPEISIPPMDHLMELKRDEAFSHFIDKHRQLAGDLISIFMATALVSLCYIDQIQKSLIFRLLFTVFPDKFVENKAIGQAREEVTVVTNENLRTPIEIPKDYTASDHQVYPGQGPENVVKKDRRGELFYYMHQQIIARAYAARLANSQLKNLNRVTEGSRVDVQALERWRSAIFDAIDTLEVKDVRYDILSGTFTWIFNCFILTFICSNIKYCIFQENNKPVALDEFTGIDILGNLIESTSLSINPNVYGNLHNQGHNLISLIHDPDSRHLEEPGVMGDVATAMRDPIFYRWHGFIDSIFQYFKARLPRYTEAQKGGQPNELTTFWQQSEVNISRGLDFQNRGKIFVRFTHLQHAEFKYTVTVENTTGEMRQGTCRIFLTPKFDEGNNPWKFPEQKNLMVEMDKFKVDSIAISMTNPKMKLVKLYSISADVDGLTICWVPKGMPGGMKSELFVMISNYADDKVEQETGGECNDAYSYCGIRDKLYPDRRSMGFPFDRQARDGVNTLQDF